MKYQEAIEVLNNHERYVGVKYVNGVEEAYVTPYFEKALNISISAMQKLNEYEQKLRELYGEYDGLLEKIIDGFEKYNKSIEMKTPFKSRLLTDYDVDLWDEYKKLGTIEEVREAMKEFQIIKSADGDLESCISELEQAKYDIETYWEEPTKLSKAMGMAIKALKENQEYKKLGTLEELQTAAEKQKEKIPTYDGNGYAPDGTFVWDEWLCPNCGTRYEVDYDDYDYCPNCGQRILWEE